MQELQLIQACLQNNAAAQRELYNRYCQRLFNLCVRYARNKEDAEDMLQEAFIKIFTSMDAYHSKGNFEGWLKRIVVYTCINHIKKNKKFNDLLNIDFLHDLRFKEESVASKLLGKQVMNCLLQMPIGYRTVINLFVIEGYSHKEIGEMLEISENTSRSQYMRGKTVLENILIKNKIIESTGATTPLDWMAALHTI